MLRLSYNVPTPPKAWSTEWDEWRGRVRVQNETLKGENRLKIKAWMPNRRRELALNFVNGATLTSPGNHNSSVSHTWTHHQCLSNCFLKSSTIWVRGTIDQAHWGVKIIWKKQKQCANYWFWFYIALIKMPSITCSNVGHTQCKPQFKTQAQKKVTRGEITVCSC